MKTAIARPATNSFLCGICINPKAPRQDREYCKGNGSVTVSLRKLAEIRHGHDEIFENVKFTCGHSHTITLRGN